MNDLNKFDAIYKNIYATITAEEGIKQDKKAYILGDQPGCVLENPDDINICFSRFCQHFGLEK